MRTLLLIAVLSACGTEPCDGPQTKCVSADTLPPTEVAAPAEATPPPGVKVHGNLPIRTEGELEAQATTRANCVTTCTEGDEACKQACFAATPIEQVEVVPDMPIGLPE